MTLKVTDNNQVRVGVSLQTTPLSVDRFVLHMLTLTISPSFAHPICNDKDHQTQD